jgi:hypothetical protein
MLKKLEIDSLRADLASVNALLAKRSEESDPIGWLQFSHRKKELEEEIAKLQEAEATTGIGLFFGGQPVLGSRGIQAEFAGKALKSFQDIISKRFACLESGPLGSRGPIPMRGNAQLLITDVVRGSFGFILEEASEEAKRGDATLKEVMKEVSQLVFQISTEEESDDHFVPILETIDNRILVTLREFFQLLDESWATLRVVEGQTDYLLSREAIKRARRRIDTLEISEKEDEDITGRLFILPGSRKFELYLSNIQMIHGSISPQCLEEIIIQHGPIDANITGHIWHTRMKVREMKELNKPTKHTYILMQLIEKT